MTPEEREEMNRLNILIQDEKDHQKFTQHIAQLIESGTQRTSPRRKRQGFHAS
jgi:hypothetical protein